MGDEVPHADVTVLGREDAGELHPLDLQAGVEIDLETGLEIERMQFAGVFATRDRAIGMASFAEHGPGKAKFEGR